MNTAMPRLSADDIKYVPKYILDSFNAVFL